MCSMGERDGLFFAAKKNGMRAGVFAHAKRMNVNFLRQTTAVSGAAAYTALAEELIENTEA